MQAPTITTPTHHLRPFVREDAVLWQQWDVDAEVQAHMPEPRNVPEDIERQYEYMSECEQDPAGIYWSIETADGRTIGTVSLFEIDAVHGSAQIGIVIGDKKSWGRGVATEIVRSVVDYAFGELKLHYISAEVESPNIAMQKVFTKTGFVADGLFKSARSKNGGRVDVVHFGVGR